MLTKLRVFCQFQKALLFQYGWIVSWWKGKPVDRNGKPLPWITYPAIDFLSQFDYSRASVFEWGSGFSTLWWAERCREIVSVETNVDWVPYIRPMLPNNVKLLTPEFNELLEAAAIDCDQRFYDVIVVDNNGPFRPACAEKAISHLADGGVLIVDNSDQCLVTTALLRSAGFCQIDFTGFAPANSYAQTTSLFFRNRIALPLRLAHQPVSSVAQPNPPWEGC